MLPNDIAHPRVVAKLSSRGLLRNYRTILQRAPGHEIIAMVKANGYGHGDQWVATELLQMPKLRGFGVATLEEGAQIRRDLGAKGQSTEIIVFSGATPWTDEKGAFCQRYGLTPVIASDADWAAFYRRGWPTKISYELKFNTGMNRLGISHELARTVAAQLAKQSSSWLPAGVLTHLAEGEAPNTRLSRRQRALFQEIRGDFHARFGSVRYHMANSAAIWNFKAWGLEGLTHSVRPGLALYGIEPWEGASRAGLDHVMTIHARVVHVLTLQPGDYIGYGGIYQVPKKSKPVRAAIIAAGYADGMHRELGNAGEVWVGGKLEHYLGRISMDLSAISCGPKVKAGDWVEVLGPHILPWKQAKKAGTVPYELLTSVSNRVERRNHSV
ncbi:MAG: alanine racemase [Bacteriovoracia bacterium]